MAIKKCCITNCSSCSTRTEDFGVTYHKFPKNTSLNEIWANVTQYKLTVSETIPYVCSRHFCKSDFKIYKDSKYVLKSDAVPSIFPWISNDNKLVEIKMESDDVEKKTAELNTSKESEGDNLEEIKKFIENEECKVDDAVPSTSKESDKDTADAKVEVDGSKDFDERLAVASSMMDTIVNESEERLTRKKEGKPSKKRTNSGEKGMTLLIDSEKDIKLPMMVHPSLHYKSERNSSMALSVGSKVEARDFGEYWYPAKIVEVDYEEMEVLVHYENSSKRHDEWISVSSPRLRPLSAKPMSPTPTPAPVVTHSSPAANNLPAASKDIKQEPRVLSEEKPKLVFVVGERCLARWRDNRRFTATVNKDLGNGHYEVVFDDGFLWECTTNRMYKMKDPVKTEGLTVDTTGSPVTGAPSPAQYGAGPTLPLMPAFHTHLFDPTRDYLGSKSERREMKRKLNIKEIFNIGQKKKKTETKEKVAGDTPVVKKKPKLIRKKPELQPTETVKTEIPDAVASIIGTAKDEPAIVEVKKEESEQKVDIKEEPKTDTEMLQDDIIKTEDNEIKVEENVETCTNSNSSEKEDLSMDPVQKEEVKLEKFEKIDDTKHEEVIDRMKEVINKLEDGINKVQNSPKPEIKEEPLKSEPEPEPIKLEGDKEMIKDKSKKLAKIKKGKRLRLLQEKKVKKQVEKVKSELEEMKRQVEEMRKQMCMAKTEEVASGQKEMPESFLLPGEWCCKWVNGQPLGKVSELDAEVRDANAKPGLPRRSVQVEDKRLPTGWTKHMVRRSLGNSAGKWDVVLVSPENRRFHTKTDMKNYIENTQNPSLQEYEHALMDFGVHLKLARRMGWVKTTPGGVDETPVIPLPAGTLCSTSPLVKRRQLSLKKVRKEKEKKRKLGITIRMPKYLTANVESDKSASGTEPDPSLPHSESSFGDPPLEDGFVYVGSLKVQIIENLLRCPAEGCFKNFRNNTLLKMHIKHYHRELRKMLGRTPKVLDLAYARTMPTSLKQTKAKDPNRKRIKIKISRQPKRVDEPKPEVKEPKPEILEPQESLPMTVDVETEDTAPKLLDSPKLRHALINKPVKRPRVLLPVRRLEPDLDQTGNHTDSSQDQDPPIEPIVDVPLLEILDFETAISTHTVTKPADLFKKKDKKMAVLTPKLVSEDEDWFAATSDVETRSSFPRSLTPDSKIMDQKLNPVSSESNEDQKDANYMYTENGERIKIVHMKREEIINCHCGFREEDGLMVQCELCLCWQHALCHNIQKESEVPEKYTCSICLNPRRGRRSQRFLHDQDRLYEGLLPGARASEPLRRSHELSGNLLRIQDALHALRVKYYVATKKDHPKLYLWAKDWENGELNISQDRLNSEYSDLNLMISSIGKENLPVRPEDLKDQIEFQTPPSEEHDRYSQREGSMGSQTLLSGLLSSPGGASLDLPLPLSAAELERLANTVQEDLQRVSAPQPEAAIENSACRERLLRHIQRCQAVMDARLDSIEAQVAELESQDPSFEDDETADYFPRTKQTIQMLMRDLDTMEELGVIT